MLIDAALKSYCWQGLHHFVQKMKKKIHFLVDRIFFGHRASKKAGFTLILGTIGTSKGLILDCPPTMLRHQASSASDTLYCVETHKTGAKSGVVLYSPGIITLHCSNRMDENVKMYRLISMTTDFDD